MGREGGRGSKMGVARRVGVSQSLATVMSQQTKVSWLFGGVLNFRMST